MYADVTAIDMYFEVLFLLLFQKGTMIKVYICTVCILLYNTQNIQ